MQRKRGGGGGGGGGGGAYFRSSVNIRNKWLRKGVTVPTERRGKWERMLSAV